VRISVDELEIVGVRSLTVELSTGVEADMFQAGIPNVGGEYTGLFVRPWEMQQTQAPTPAERKKLFDGQRCEVAISGEVCFRGFVDDARMEEIPTPGIEITGRDYTGLLLDEVVSPALATAVSNVTSSTAVSRIANAFGLTPKVDRTTRVWDENQAFAAGTSVWGVVAELAGKEGFDAYVTREKELVFRKRVMPSVISRTIVVPGENGDSPSERSTRGTVPIFPEELEFYTAKTMALGLKVRCTGYDPKANRSIVFTAESPLRNRPNYRVIEVPDRSLRTREQVSAKAWAELLRISKGLVTGRYRGPVDGKLRPGQAIEVRYQKAEGRRQNEEPLEGTYFVTKVKHQLTQDGEFTTEAEFASKPLAIGTVEVKEVERETEDKKQYTISPPGVGAYE